MPSDVDFPGEVMNYLSIPNNWPLGAVDADVATLLDTNDVVAQCGAG
jgi:hypothetical protein